MASQKLYPEGILGKKLGMTQVYTPEGECVPVTVIQAGPCYVLDVKNREQHGYSAVQLGFEPRKQQRVSKPAIGHFSRAGKGAFYHVQEVRCDVEALGWKTLGHELKVGDIFNANDMVDVSGVSVGRGFAGVVKRFGVKGQPSTRGTHEYRRHIGAIGCRKFPGRVFKNQRMPGHKGNASVTIQNLQVMAVKPDENVILVRGGVPGAKGGVVVIRRAVKSFKTRQAAA